MSEFSSVITTHSRTRTSIETSTSLVVLPSPALVRSSDPQTSPKALIHLPRDLPRSSEGRSSNAGTITLHVRDSVEVVDTAITTIAYRRRRSQTPPAIGASQSQQPLSDDVVPPLSSGSPMRMGFYDLHSPDPSWRHHGKPDLGDYGLLDEEDYGQPDVGDYDQSDVGEYDHDMDNGQLDVSDYCQPDMGEYDHPDVGDYGQPDVGDYGQYDMGDYGQPDMGDYGQSDVGDYDYY